MNAPDGHKPDHSTIRDSQQVVSAYARWAPIYDLAFTAVMRAGRKAAVAAVAETGQLILDVGVGTGLELPMFPLGCRVVGIDLAEPMLRRAGERVRRDNLAGVEGLAVMDATRMAFADASFDAAIVPYVLTVVPDPTAMMDEISRVIRPGGSIVLVNHFGAEAGLLKPIEAWLGQRSASLGWHPQFPFSVLGDWVAAQRNIEMLDRRRIGPLGLFTVVRLRKTR
ncbi:class I SAM-dependent methyltransferase [Lichenihabitans psoromatis]|uniref:class I SAM-dependent methyltransferase n=1 Tax=Lichenihabitans psoromatis TaxID=2528642 RepID=UPI0010383328|nr:class I SAM-dependent methyltransferase [Lichenihabitans psoromatis]